MNPIERAFHDAMLDVYKRAKSEAGYNATRFLTMVNEHGGLETARHIAAFPRRVRGLHRALGEGASRPHRRGRDAGA